MKTLRYASLTLFAVLVLVMAYGLFHFPFAPYNERNGHYIDKRGDAHSLQEVERLRVWQKVLFTSWGASAISILTQKYAQRRARRHQSD